MTGRDVVCVAPTEWDGAWQRYHEMMHRFAAGGNVVLVLDNLYRILPPFPESAAGAARLAGKAWNALSRMRLRPRWVEPRLAILTPPVLPGVPMWLGSALLRTALNHGRQVGRRNPVLWCAFPTPYLRQIIGELAPGLIVYDCASAFADDPRAPRAVLDAEQLLLRRADLVFTDSRSLHERHAAVHARCHWVPTGVDAAKFAASLPKVRRWPGPVVGYTGTLHAWLDTGLIAEVARLRPSWQFVFAGPRRERAALHAVESLPNVELLGPQPHNALPALLAQFSAAWIPYRMTAFTRHVFPTKMLEYLAAGRPVVSTDLPEVRAFAPPVRIASDPSEMVVALEAAMRDHDGAPSRELAARYDWSVQMAEVHRHLDDALRTQ